jgi:hypothetical protein
MRCIAFLLPGGEGQDEGGLNIILFSFRRSRRRFCVRHGRMFFHMAGGRPFGKFRGIVFVGVLDDGVQDVQGDGGFVRGVFQSAGRSGLRAHAQTFGGNGGFKIRDVRAEIGEKIRIEAETDELRGERRGIGLKGAGGIEQRLVATAAGQQKFAVESRRAEKCERVRGIGNGDKVVVQVEAGGDFGHDAAVRSVFAGNLLGSERSRLRNGGADEGELLSAHAGGGKIARVFESKGGDVF